MILLLRSALAAVNGRRNLLLENLALRHQLLVLHRTAKSVAPNPARFYLECPRAAGHASATSEKQMPAISRQSYLSLIDGEDVAYDGYQALARNIWARYQSRIVGGPSDKRVAEIRSPSHAVCTSSSISRRFCFPAPSLLSNPRARGEKGGLDRNWTLTWSK